MTSVYPSLNSSARTRALPFAQVLCPCWVHDTYTGALLDANPAALKLYGYDRAKFLTLSVDGLRHAQEHRHLDIHLDASAAAAAEGRPAVRPPAYWLHRTKTGASLAVTLSALEVDWNGRPARLVFVTDVTALRAARLESKLLQRCMECDGDMIVVTQADAEADGSHPIHFVNRAFEQHTGYSSNEVLGCDAAMFHGPLTDTNEVERMRTAMSRSEPVVVELWHYDKLGTPYQVEMTLTPVADERGWLQYWVSSRRDISERDQAAVALRELNEALEAQANERALHALNHSMTLDAAKHLIEVRSFADMIQVQHGAALPDDAARLLDLLQQSAHQMHQLLHRPAHHQLPHALGQGEGQGTNRHANNADQ
jgi:PAS domain S-box-containing protein